MWVWSDSTGEEPKMFEKQLLTMTSTGNAMRLL